VSALYTAAAAVTVQTEHARMQIRILVVTNWVWNAQLPLTCITLLCKVATALSHAMCVCLVANCCVDAYAVTV
jgi:hypothetical protein